MERIGAAGEYAAVAAFPLETALAAVSFLAHGVMERHPRLRQGYGISAAMRQAMREKPASIARRFWFDTIVYSIRRDTLPGRISSSRVDRSLVPFDCGIGSCLACSRRSALVMEVCREPDNLIASESRLLGSLKAQPPRSKS